MPAHTLAELQFKKPADKLCDVKALELVDVLGKMVVGKKRQTRRESRRDVEFKALVKMLAYRVAEEKAKKVRTTWAMCRPGHWSTKLLPHLQR